jgi:hypothetical protein
VGVVFTNVSRVDVVFVYVFNVTGTGTLNATYSKALNTEGSVAEFTASSRVTNFTLSPSNINFTKNMKIVFMGIAMDLLGVNSTNNDNGTATIANLAPNILDIGISPASPVNTSDLVVTETNNDADNDTLTYFYFVYRNNSLFKVFSKASGANAANSLFTITAANHSKNVNVTIQKFVFDGQHNSTATNASVLILNSAPSLGAVSISPSSPIITSTLNASVSSVDDIDEGLSEVSTFFWFIYRNNILNRTVATSVNYTTLAGPSVGFTEGDNWTFSVQAFDGQANSSRSNNSVSFGSVTAPTPPPGGAPPGGSGGGAAPPPPPTSMNISSPDANTTSLLIAAITGDPSVQDAIYDIGVNASNKDAVNALASTTATVASAFGFNVSVEHISSTMLRLKMKYSGLMELRNVVLVVDMPKSFESSSDQIIVQASGGGVSRVLVKDPKFSIKYGSVLPGQTYEILFFTPAWSNRQTVLSEFKTPLVFVKETVTAAPPKAAVCGNGLKETGEECDKTAPEGYTCSAQCKLVKKEVTPAAVCGNGVTEAGEECDTTVPEGYVCSSTCKLEEAPPKVAAISPLAIAGVVVAVLIIIALVAAFMYKR